MSRLLIGAVTDGSARIWVRGRAQRPWAFVEVFDDRRRKVAAETKELEERHFFTGVVEVGGLAAGTEHTCKVAFGPGPESAPAERESPPDSLGRFRTFPPPDAEAPLTFLVGSCNLHSLGVLSAANPAYRRLAAKAREADAELMIHCGDQIYYDRPNFNRAPRIEDYRGSYLDAWGDSQETRKFLAALPHFMILDDHEIRDNFRNDMEVKNASPATLKDSALKVYREFQHIHNPNTFGHECLYYAFGFGRVRFFVMDTRSERWGEGESQMIGSQQLERLLAWLSEHREAVKLVVTSVPLLGEVLNTDDKWCSAPYRHQREAILGHLRDEDIGSLVFLTGDMHNSYHAETVLRRGNAADIRIHELMSSPINQLGKQSRSRYRTGESFPLPGGGSYSTTFPTNGRAPGAGEAGGGDAGAEGVEEFFTGHSNAMLVRVDAGRVDYEVFRTKKDRTVLTASFAV